MLLAELHLLVHLSLALLAGWEHEQVPAVSQERQWTENVLWPGSFFQLASSLLNLSASGRQSMANWRRQLCPLSSLLPKRAAPPHHLNGLTLGAFGRKEELSSECVLDKEFV